MMQKLGEQLRQFTPSQQREILYFLVRYFKQTHRLETEGKNIFDDVFDRVPDPVIHEATLEAIGQIEAQYGKPAHQFDDAMADEVLDMLTDIEDGIEAAPSEAEKAKASAFFRRIG